MTQFKLRDIKPNPFRRLEHYPVREDKVNALRESIRSTEFWDNIVARKCDGGAEIAYGHHRLVALQREYDPDHEVGLIVRDLDDTTMFQIMVRENSEEWGADASVDQEVVRSAVRAYGDGRIALPDVPKDTRRDEIRHADVVGPAQPRPYTAKTLSAFLAWSLDKTRNALRAIDLIDAEEIPQDTYRGIGPEQALHVSREATRAKQRIAAAGGSEEQARRKAAEVAKAVADGMRSGDFGKRHVRQITDELTTPKSAAPPDINDYAMRLASRINRYLDPTHSEDGRSLEKVIEFRDYLDECSTHELVTCLRNTSDRLSHLADAVASRKVKKMEAING